jgi:hypothetical protein
VFTPGWCLHFVCLLLVLLDDVSILCLFLLLDDTSILCLVLLLDYVSILRLFLLLDDTSILCLVLLLDYVASLCPSFITSGWCFHFVSFISGWRLHLVSVSSFLDNVWILCLFFQQFECLLDSITEAVFQWVWFSILMWKMQINSIYMEQRDYSIILFHCRVTCPHVHTISFYHPDPS